MSADHGRRHWAMQSATFQRRPACAAGESVDDLMGFVADAADGHVGCSASGRGLKLSLRRLCFWCEAGKNKVREDADSIQYSDFLEKI